MKEIKVLVADDHSILREGLCRLLNDEKDIQVAGQAENSEKALELAIKIIPDVAIIDISMPGIDGIELTRQIKEQCPDMAILVVSAYNYEHYIISSLRAGASGYLLKSTPVSELVNSIRLVYAGLSVFNLQSIDSIIKKIDENENVSGKGCGPIRSRELDVLKLAAQGLSNKEIAAKLYLSTRTVETHMVNIFRKIDVGSRTEAVLYALKKGWISADNVSQEGAAE